MSKLQAATNSAASGAIETFTGRRFSPLAQRIRRGDVKHDPKGNDCPAWCDFWPMCRVERA